MKSTVILFLSLLLFTFSLSAGWKHRSSRRGKCAMPENCEQSAPKYWNEPYTKYVRETRKIPEYTYTPEEKWVQGTKYIPRYYQQKFIKYVPQVFTQTVMKYEPVGTYCKYYDYNECVNYHYVHSWIPETGCRKRRFNPPPCDQCGDRLACPDHR